MDRVAVFGLCLLLIQTVEGTAFYFSIGTLAFLMLAALAFNAAGGLTRASGAYIFFYAVLVFVLGICYKAVLFEPAESNLRDPKTTIAVYVGGMAAMFLAAVAARKLTRKTGLLENTLPDRLMYRATIGCIVFALFGPFVIGMLGSAGNRLNSAFVQLNELMPLAIIIGSLYEIRRSGGTRSINTPVVFAIVYTFILYGLLGFSKQGLLTPLYCWLVVVCATRYRLTSLQVLSCGLWVLFVFQFLVPYSQYGRQFVSNNPSTSERFAIALRLLSSPNDVRRNYKELQEAGGDPVHYFNTAQGFWDRLTFIATDDSLINVTDQGRVFGYLPITASFVNAIPHVFLPNKPVYNFGNMYAHEIGGLPDEDTTTGISFSPTAEAFHLGRWVGLLVVAPLVWTLLFFILDSLCGDLRKTPWGLLAIAMLSHLAPETGLEGAIYMSTFGAEILIFCSVFATRVAPSIASVILGAQKPPLQPLRVRQPLRTVLPEVAPRGLE